jgi:hypothetical protein
MAIKRDAKRSQPNVNSLRQAGDSRGSDGDFGNLPRRSAHDGRAMACSGTNDLHGAEV